MRLNEAKISTLKYWLKFALAVAVFTHFKRGTEKCKLQENVNIRNVKVGLYCMLKRKHMTKQIYKKFQCISSCK